MRRTLLFLLILAVFACAPAARATGGTPSDAYALALDCLRKPTDADKALLAQNLFNHPPLHENYKNVSLLIPYAEALVCVHNEDFETARFYYDILPELNGCEEFRAFLEEEGLISIEHMRLYVDAREYELAGDWAAAEAIYKETLAMDSVNRLIHLGTVVYPEKLKEARGLMARGQYAAAREMLERLSQARAKGADALLNACNEALGIPAQTPTPAPAQTPTPSPSRKPAPTPTPAPEYVVFADEALEQKVRACVGIRAPRKIYPSDLLKIRDLDISGTREKNGGIRDIAPLAYMTNLRCLYAQYNQIEDLSPLENLTGLTYLNLFDNRVADLEPLSNLTALNKLYLDNNCISNLYPLIGLKNLTRLYLSGNPITDDSPLNAFRSTIEPNHRDW